MTTRAQRSRGMPRRAIARAASPRRMPILVAAAVAVLLVVAAVAAVVISAGPAGSVAEPARAPIDVAGPGLPPLTDAANDPAVGQPVPRLGGIGVDGSPVTFGPSHGPMAIVVLAHWCSYCQAEVPALMTYLDTAGMPGGVELVALTTAIDPARPNYPPSAWLQREGWSAPTLVDDAHSSGLSALGLTSFPGFVFVDAEGRVAHRHAGALGAEAFAELVGRLVPSP